MNTCAFWHNFTFAKINIREMSNFFWVTTWLKTVQIWKFLLYVFSWICLIMVLWKHFFMNFLFLLIFYILSNFVLVAFISCVWTVLSLDFECLLKLGWKIRIRIKTYYLPLICPDACFAWVGWSLIYIINSKRGEHPQQIVFQSKLLGRPLI